MTIHAVKFVFLRNRGSSEHVSSACLFSCNFKVLENKLVTHFRVDPKKKMAATAGNI
jgi:hypothetical protein